MVLRGLQQIDEYGQFRQAMNFPQPFFVQTGPAYMRVLTSDELMLQIQQHWHEDGHVLRNAPNARLYVKLPHEPDLQQVIPEMYNLDADGDPLITFRVGDDMDEYLHIEGVQLVLAPI